MSKADILEKLKDAMIDLDDEAVENLIKESKQSGLTTMEIVVEGLNPGLVVIGEGFEKTSDL